MLSMKMRLTKIALAIAGASWLLIFYGCAKVLDPDPSRCAIQGIDLSHYQGDIEWSAVARSGIRFAWLKATEGGDYRDPKFRQNWELARSAGVRRGAYLFAYWCRPGADQAAWFISNVPNDPDALPPVLDLEWTPQSRSCPKKPPRDKVLADVKIMLDAMERAYGRRPVIYTAPDFYSDILANEFRDYPFWVRSLDTVPARVYERRWLIWQYSSKGSVAGIAGEVDRNCFAGQVDDWERWVRS